MFARIAFAAIMFVALMGGAQSAPLPHPRMYLDSATMTRLQQARTSNTLEWQRLKNWCDNHLGQNLGDTYQYLDWYEYVLNYGLMYRITGTAAYGNEGVKYLVALLRDRSAINDGLGGTNAIQTDSGYVSRSLGVGVAQGRDWLDGAPHLTSAIISECTTRMGEWYTWIHRPQTFGIDDPLDNYFAGHFAMTYSAAIAFEGDPGYNSAWFTKAEAMWVDVRNACNTELDGGDYLEGWNYGPRAMRHLLGYPWALETGTALPNHWNEIDITSELVRSHIAMLHPSRASCSDDGRWSGDTKGDPRSTLCRMMSVVSDTDATARGLARWYANHLTGEVGGPSEWEGMLFTDRNIAEIAPTAANMGGLTWKGWGHATTRGDDWSNLNATFVDVVGWTYGAEEANFGELKIVSRGEQLLTDGQTWQLESTYANVPRITGNHTYAPYQEYWHDTAKLTVDAVDKVYTYFKLDKLEQAYNGVNNDTPSAAYFRRDVVFLPPDLTVVYDNFTATALTNLITEQWHTMGNPTVSGNGAVLSAPNAKLFVQMVNPAGTLTKTNTNASRAGTYRIDGAITTPTIYNRIITVFETAGTTQTAMGNVSTFSATNYIGLHFTQLAQPRLLLLPTSQNPSNTNVSFTFTPVATSSRVVMLGVQPNTGFAVSTAPAGAAQTVTIQPGTQFTSAANGSLTFTINSTPSGVADWVYY